MVVEDSAGVVKLHCRRPIAAKTAKLNSKIQNVRPNIKVILLSTYRKRGIIVYC